MLALGLLVFIHELGHFLAARAFGIRVEKFYVFFDFNGIKLFSRKIGDTEYGIGWFPMGGYVKISGMIDESMDTEQMKNDPQPWEFRSKPAWQRLIVMMGGIIMNILLGIIIFTFYLSYYQKEYIDPNTVKDGIYAYSTGYDVGFRTGDKILSINGHQPQRESDLTGMSMFLGAKVKVERGGKDTTLVLSDTLFLKLKAAKDAFIALHNFPFYVDSVLVKDDAGDTTIATKIGLQPGDKITAINNEPVTVFGDIKTLLTKYDSTKLDVTIMRGNQVMTLHTDTLKYPALGFVPGPRKPYPTVAYTLPRAFKFGVKDGFETIYYQAIGIGKMLTGKLSARDNLQSPIGIARVYGGQWVWPKFWFLTGLISFILAFMNFLPIPALDGGHVMFIIIEVIQGRPVSEKFMENAQKVGIVILLALMLFAFGNDIFKIIFKH